MANYIVKKIEQKHEWETFLRSQEYNIFVQSWHYGEFNNNIENPSFVLGVYDQIGEKKELLGGSLVIEVKAKRGNFFYLPYGPILNFDNNSLSSAFFEELKNLAKHRGVNFIRISPFIEDSKDLRKSVRSLGFKKAPMHMIAENTWVLPLEADEVDILKNMNQNHRNLIRRAARDGVEIKTSEEVLDVKKLHELLQETAKKHKFVPFSLKYLENEFKVFQNRGEAKLYFAYHNNELLGANMIIFNGNSAVYRHGASADVKTKVPFSYALQWEAIQEAKMRGLKYYNFWGIAPEGKKNHPFSGITHFKKGFGGFKLDLLPAHDLPINNKYWLNWIIETLRKFKRGF